MNTREPTIRIVLEISQEKYLSDEDYRGLDVSDLTDRHKLARLLDKDCYYPVKISLDKTP